MSGGRRERGERLFGGSSSKRVWMSWLSSRVWRSERVWEEIGVGE